MGFRDSETIIEPVDGGGAFDSNEGSITSTSESSANALAAANSAEAALASKIAAELAETNAETAETNAETAETNAETAETNASTSATNAATSETNASTSETNAAASASAAASSAADAQSSEDDAEVSETNAANSAAAALVSENNASSSETNAATSAVTAATQAGISTTKAGEASVSAAAALVSENNAGTSETNAADSETNAATSATNAAASETNAATSATNAATSETNAATSATAADTSATNASNSESAASTSETNAATSETNAGNSATAAATSATNAATSETNAANSATAAATSETNSANSATASDTAKTAAQAAQTAAETAETNAETAETNAGNSATAAATSATNSANSATAAASSASAASTSETNAATSATNAATSETNAATSEANASNSATSANNSATAAQTAQAATELVFDNFDDKFLGTKSSDPSVDNDGNALVEGAMYYNSSSNAIKFYNGSSWEAPSVAASNSATAAATSATNASNSAGAASTSASNAANSATSAATSETNSASSASAASTSETNAATSATNSANSATAAQTAETNAETAQAAAETAETNAETAQAAAETAETNAETSETNAAASASTASTQAGIATTKAGEASTSATNAATSETNAATSETNAATSETNAAASETNAATSATASEASKVASVNAQGASETAETNAETAQAAAETAQTAAETAETNAATSETNAASSASSASTDAGTATTKAGEAATSATNAAASASTATTKASEASTSASTAATSETNAATSATNAATSETNSSNSATASASSASAASTSETNAATSETNAGNSATASASSASAASTSETNAATSASGAATSATNASTSATAAQTAQTAAEAALDSFDDRYLGEKSSDPTVDNDGDALLTGALYFSTGGGSLKVYDGTQWNPTAATTESIQDVVGSLITGTTGVSATYNDSGNSLTIAGTAATTSAAGTMSAADKTKLDGVEASATADQTAAEIRTLVESATDSNVFTDADHTKLDGIETGADVTDTANVVAALTAGTGVSISAGGEVAVTVNHDNLAGFVANEHIDWTADQGATNIHSGNYVNTTYSNLNEFTNGPGYITDYTVTEADVTGHEAALSITESQISDLGSYLTAHPSITAASSVNNTGRTYIQDITLDSNGHITGITSATETGVNTDTTYSSGSGLNLTGTTFSVTDAPKWTTARTLSLSGDASGSVSWDGSANATLTVTVADDSHNHVISNVNGLQTELDGKADIYGSISNNFNARTVKLANVEKSNLDTDGQLGFDSSQGLLVYRTQQGTTGTVSVLDGANVDAGTGVSITNTGTGGTGTESFTFSIGQAVGTSDSPTFAGATIGGGTPWTNANDGSGSGLDADLLDGINSVDYSRKVMETASGNSSSANYWAKIATYDISGNYNDGTFLYFFMNEESSTNSAAAIVGVTVRTNNVSNADPNSVNLSIIGMHGSDPFDDDSFKLLDNGSGTDIELWVKKNSNYDHVSVYEHSAHMEGVSVTYHNNSAWQASEPTGTGNNLKSNGLEYRNYKVWHQGNDGPGSGLDADLLDGISSSSFARYDASGTLSNALASGAWVSNYSTSTNVDHVWHDDGANAWNFNSDTTFKSTANSRVNAGSFYAGGNVVWNAGNDGTGSGLDADTVDGVHADALKQAVNATALTSSDSIDSVTDGWYRWHNSSPTGAYADYMVMVQSTDGAQPTQLTFGTTNHIIAVRRKDAGTWSSWAKMWSNENDGSGSGLDADLLDGQHGSYYTGYTDTAIANLVDSSPAALNTLNELAAALGDDANFSTTVTNALANKVDDSQVLTDVPAGAVFTDTTYTSGDFNHDSLSGFVANEHIDWTTDQGATNIHSGNYVNTVYTHPTHPGDDISVDTGALTGATVISDLDFNVTTDTLGHVTDANATVATRTLTLADLGYTGATNANYITNNSQLTNGAGYTTNVGDITGVTAGSGITGGGTSGTVTINHADTSSQASVDNSGGTVIQDITLDTYGHITGIASANLDGRYVNVTGDSMTGNLSFGDNDKATFGASADLQVYHTGSTSYIFEQGTGDLRIRGNEVRIEDGDGSTIALFQNNAGAQLRHNGTTVLNTNATGIDVTGTVNANSVDLGSFVVTETNGHLYFSVNGVNKMKLDSSGNLQVVGNVDSNATIT